MQKKEMNEEINPKTAAGTSYMLLRLKTHVYLGLRAKGRTLETKIYKTIVKNIVTYGAETWPMTEKNTKD
jgi:hypothetical protein